MSYLSRVQYTGTGSNALYSIPFAYISKAYVEVRVGGSLLADGVGYTWQSATSILLSAGNLATGVVLDIRRATPKTSKLVDFQDGSVLTEASLDLANDQVFQLVQENLDDMADRLAVQTDGTIDGLGRRIKNVADPVSPQDATTKSWVETNYGASNTTQAGVYAAQAAASAAQAANRVKKTSDTGSAVVPTGTTAERDLSPVLGYFRFNSTLGKFEGYTGSAWGSVGGGATGAGGDDAFYENTQTVTVDYTITTGKNAMSAGPITINNGVTVTVPNGARWTIV